MTILEKIRQAKTKQDLDFLTQEIIFSPDHKENIEAFKVRLKELENSSVEGREGQL